MLLRYTGRLLSALVVLAGPSFAEGWEGVVVGQSGSTAPKAFADAFHASEALRKGGFETVQMLRDVPSETVFGAIAALEGADSAVFYFSGPVTGDTVWFENGPVGITDIIDGLSSAGIRRAALLIEDCADPNGVGNVAMPTLPVSPEIYVASTAGPTGSCASTVARMTDKLQVASDTSLQEALDGVWFETTLADPIELSSPQVLATPKAAAPVISIVSSNVVAITPVASPVQIKPTLASVTPSAATSQPRPSSSGGSVVTFAPVANSQLAAIPAAAGLPEPSIIVGLIEQASLEFDQVAPPADVSSSEVSYDNLEARRNLRDSSPDLFETLVQSGAFDPPENLLPAALQTELSRMGCYTSAIDGIWGRGSRASVERYFAEISGVNAVSLEPEIPLFRQIIRQDDIVCKAPQAAPARATTTASRPSSGTTTRRTTTTTRQTAAPKRQTAAPKRQTAPAASSGRKIKTNRLGGVFR